MLNRRELIKAALISGTVLLLPKLIAKTIPKDKETLFAEHLVKYYQHDPVIFFYAIMEYELATKDFEAVRRLATKSPKWRQIAKHFNQTIEWWTDAAITRYRIQEEYLKIAAILDLPTKKRTFDKNGQLI